MADIELVIKIPEGLKNDFESEQWTALSCMEMKDALEKATPLPKRHGRLIDADDAKREWRNVLDCEVEHPRYQCTIRDVLEDAPTIIEADKAESEDKE